MNPILLPDVAGLLLLIVVLAWLRRRYRDSSVDSWLTGLVFILIEAIAYGVSSGNAHFYRRMMHVIALDSYILAAVAFGAEAIQGVPAAPWKLPSLALPAIPMLVIATVYGLDVLRPAVYSTLILMSLCVGAALILMMPAASRSSRLMLLAIHGCIWIPMAFLVNRGGPRFVVYFGLASLYALVALSQRRRLRSGGIGGVVLIAGFGCWVLCFLAHPLVRGLPIYDGIVEQVWNMQKFFVIIGMLLVSLEEQTRRREAESMHDPLTLLPNRRLFDDRLTQSLARSRRKGTQSAVFVLDFDGFKQVNDTDGHSAGDELLREAARLLMARIRDSDTLARCGGDEFCIVANDVRRREDCDLIAAVLRSAVAQVTISSGKCYSLSLSVGYALFPQDSTDPLALYALADRRMYAEKREFRGSALPEGRPARAAVTS